MRSRFVQALLASVLLLSVAGPSWAGDADGAPRAGAQAAEPGGCELRNPNLSPHDEWGRCMTVEATLSRAPAEGRTATLSYEVRSDVAQPDAAVSVSLPESLAFVRPPEGASLRDVGRARGAGPATIATAHHDLAADAVQRFTVPVRAIEEGVVEIVVRVTAPRADGGTDAAEDRVFVTVGDTAASSQLGIDSSTRLGTAPAPARTGRPQGAAAHRAVPEGGPRPTSQVRPGDGGDAERAGLTVVCASGTWSYRDPQGTQRPAPNFGVEVWDADASGGHDLLASWNTVAGGSYNLCYDNADVDAGGLVDPFVRFVAVNARWRIRDTAAGNRTYTFDLPAVTDQAQNVDFGSRQPADVAGMRVLRAYDAVNAFWNWVPSSCWDANDAPSACRQYVINWTPTSTDGTYYSTANNDIHLAAADPDSAHVVIHEATHAATDDVYEDAYPPIPNCIGHVIQQASSPGCAWTEGFAEWVPASVLRDPAYRWPDGSVLPLEAPTWGTPGWDDGLAVEGRVAGAMIDIEDLANEPVWDRANEGDHRHQWATFVNGSALSYYQHFEVDRVRMGYETSDEGSRAATFQNTLGISFHEPLADGVELDRPTPTPHRYRYTTTRPTWSAVAVRPPAGADYDLLLHDSRSGVGLLDGSALGSDTIDYLVVDSRRRALGDYYPEVTAVAGSGSYRVETAQAVTTVGDGVQAIPGGHTVAVTETPLDPGVPTYFRVVPANAGQDPELLLHGQFTGTSSPVQGRRSAEVVSSNLGAGLPETLSYTSPVSQWGALVVTSRAGSGGYTLYRDSTAPTGSVVINGGAASTASATVTLSLAAADAQTGISGMKISTDGSVDTEPVEPLTATRTVTLPAGTGDRTVLVRYYNRAGMPAQDVSDSVTVTGGAADLRVSASSNPPATKARGTSFPVTDTTANRGTATAVASTTRYYLSRDTVKGTGDVLLTGARAVPQLLAGGASAGSRSVTIPAGAPTGTYYLLACSDDRRVVAETDEANNCRPSTATVRVT